MEKMYRIKSKSNCEGAEQLRVKQIREMIEMDSIWSQTVQIPERKALTTEEMADVAVIGAGIAGLLTAYYLQKEGKKVVVLEADRIAGGQTKNTTAKITSQHGMIYSSLIENYGEEKARLYAGANEMAIKEYEDLIKKEQIDCHFERLSSYLYSTEDADKLKKEAKAAASLGIKSYFTQENALPFKTVGAVCFEEQAQFHPLEFVKRLAEALIIYEKTRVLKVKGHCIETNRGKVFAKYIVFTTHYPFPNVPGLYFARQHQERSYVLALSGIPKWEGMYYSADENGISFRWFHDILLLGGGGHRTGKTAKEYGYAFLRKKAEEYYPQCKEITCWSAQDCIAHDDLPFIGEFSMIRPYWYVATGLKKWGMTGAMIAAKIICDRICGRKNPYEALFTPKRLHLGNSCGKLLKDIGISVEGLAKGHFHIPFRKLDKLPAGEGKIVRIGLKRYGVYKDEQGRIYKISVKCPHLGCELAWNDAEKTWDCPCHGSRFHYDGELIDNPAQMGTMGNMEE